MEIYILRHGIAAGAAPTGNDADRALTAEGKEKLKRVLERARAAEVEVELILTSPLRRAIETARIAADMLDYGGEIVQTDALTPDSSSEQVWRELLVYSPERVLLAGHEPLFGEFLSWLLNSPYLCVDFKKAALARVDALPTSAHPKGVLQWLITPKVSA